MIFDPASYSVREDDEKVVIMVKMTGATLIDVKVNFRTLDDTAVGITSEIEYNFTIFTKFLGN